MVASAKKRAVLEGRTGTSSTAKNYSLNGFHCWRFTGYDVTARLIQDITSTLPSYALFTKQLLNNL